jgi:predicted metal-dependent phosphoesterase TrpH
MTNSSISQSQGYADLHTHSIHSDGHDRPSDVLQKAKAAGLAGIALTDHDTLSGIDEAKAKAIELEMQFLTGVELSTTYKDKEVHVLGYFPEEPTETFKGMLADMSELRIGRMRRMIARLNALGCPIEEEYVFSLPAGGIIGRAHLFRAIRDKFSGEFNARADKWLNIGGAAFEPTSDMSPADAIAHIRSSKGVAVLAHPGTSGADPFLEELTEAGLMGIEAVYPKHDRSSTSRYKKFAKSHDLLVTGGSDWHGEFEGSVLYHSGSVGAARVPVEVIEQIREAATGA